MQHPIYPCLWFNGNAKEAADYYCSIFKNTKITAENPMVVMLDLNGSKLMLLNGGPEFKFNEAVSFVVECDGQKEIDHHWDALTANGGQESMCGWLKDKYGVSWQIVPAILSKLMGDPQRLQRVVQAFLKMKKFDIQALLDA